MNSKRHDERESDLPVNLAKPARRALVEAGYWRLEQLTEISEAAPLHAWLKRLQKPCDQQKTGEMSCVNSLSSTSYHWMAITRGQGTMSWSCRWAESSTPIPSNGCEQPRRCFWDVLPTRCSGVSGRRWPMIPPLGGRPPSGRCHGSTTS